MTDAPKFQGHDKAPEVDKEKVDREKAAKAEADRKLKAEKAEIEAFYKVEKGTEEVKDKDGNVTTQGVEGDSKQVVGFKDAYKLIALAIVEQLPESRERFFALDDLRRSLTWATEAAQRA